MTLLVHTSPFGRTITDADTGEIPAVVSNKLTPDQVAELPRNAPAIREVVRQDEEIELAFPA